MLLLARTTPSDLVEKKTEGLTVFLNDMPAAGERLTLRPIKTLMNHATTEDAGVAAPPATFAAKSSSRVRKTASSSSPTPRSANARACRASRTGTWSWAATVIGGFIRC
jgi:hypothetical protein